MISYRFKRKRKTKLTPRRNNITPNIKRHKMRPQVLHQMVHRRLARIVNKTVSEPREPAHTPNGDNLTARLALLSPLVAFNQQFQKRHGSGKHGRDIRVQRLGPDLVRPVVEVVVADFCGGRFGGWLGPCVGG
jgi:hypothetical protein